MIKTLTIAIFTSIFALGLISAQAEQASKVDHKALALKYERVNKFLNTKYPLSYGAPIYHVQKLKAQSK